MDDTKTRSADDIIHININTIRKIKKRKCRKHMFANLYVLCIYM